MVENVAELVDLAPLNEGGLAEDRARGFVQGLRAVENDQEAAVRAQPATLEIREQALTHGGVLGRAFPQPERVFLAVGRIPSATTRQCSPMCTPSRMSATSSRPSSGATCHARSCAVVLVTNRRLTLLLLVPRLTTPAGTGSRLRAYWRVATPIQMVFLLTIH